MEEDQLLEHADLEQGQNYEEIKKAVQQSTTDSNAVQNVLSSLDPFIVQYQLAAQEEKAKALQQIIIGSIFLVIRLDHGIYLTAWPKSVHTRIWSNNRRCVGNN